jgi:hypothetical protein
MLDDERILYAPVAQRFVFILFLFFIIDTLPNEIATKLGEAVATEKTLDDVHMLYAPVAQRFVFLLRHLLDIFFLHPIITPFMSSFNLSSW